MFRVEIQAPTAQGGEGSTVQKGQYIWGTPKMEVGVKRAQRLGEQGAQALAQWLTSAENTQGEPSALFSTPLGNRKSGDHRLEIHQ